MKPWVPLVALCLAVSPLVVVHPMWVEGRSMMPTLHPGDRVWVLRSWCAGAPKIGEIWRIQGPQGQVVKRVAALPDPDHPGFWVLGDNQELSQDSRMWGRVPPEAFLGRVL